MVGYVGFSATGTLPQFAAFPLDLAWMIWLVFVAWRAKEPCPSVGHAPAQ